MKRLSVETLEAFVRINGKKDENASGNETCFRHTATHTCASIKEAEADLFARCLLILRAVRNCGNARLKHLAS